MDMLDYLLLVVMVLLFSIYAITVQRVSAPSRGSDMVLTAY